MPHIILETTADLPENAQIPDILEALVCRFSTFETVDSASVKAYHTLRPNWCTGEGGKPGFAHCTVKIMSGRPLELRKRMSSGVYEELNARFAESLAANEVTVTLELLEMDFETYHK